MRAILFGLILMVGALLPISLYSQTAAIQKTTQVKERNGQKFFVHQVKKGETLYAITKTYNCTVAEIEKHNPSVKGTVNEGIELYIPQSVSSNSVSPIAKEFKQHTVVKGQTLYAISKLYAISMQDLVAVNPEISKGVSTGQVLKIPVAASTASTTPQTPASTTNKSTIHTVEKGQTIYSICQQYGISSDELNAANPSLINGLKLGTQLQIPAKTLDTSRVVVASKPTPPPARPITNTSSANTTSDANIHVVDKGETATAIAKQHGVTLEELNTLNPGIKDGIKTGMILQIPIKQKEVQSSVLGKKTSFHTVVAGETLFSIAQKYEATTSDIIILNPDLKSGAISIGMQIKVPQLETTTASLPAISSSEVPAKETLCCDSVCVPKKQINIALCLPLHLRANDTIDLTGETMVKKEERLYAKSVPYIEFYEGVLLGLDSLKRMGISVVLSVYDTQVDSTRGETTVAKLQAETNDLIICIDDDAYELIARFAQLKQTPIVHPLSTNTQYALNNPLSFIVNTPQPYRIEQLSLFTAKIPDANVVVVNNNHLQELDFTEMYRSILGSDTTRFRTVMYSKKGIKGIEAALSSSKKNIVIIPSEDQAFVNDVVTRLFQFSKRFDIDLQGLAVWETYKNIELDYLFDMNFTFATSNNRNYSDTSLRKFVLNYRNNFHTEPGRLSFLGYDVFLYFGQSLHRYGSQFASCTNRFEWSGLQTRFSFQKISERGGYVNSGVYIIRYVPENFARVEQILDVKQARTEFLKNNNQPSSETPLIKPLSTESQNGNE